MNVPISKEEERLLITQCLSGNESAFTPFITLYKDKIFYLCYKLVKDRDSAEDLTQEAFLHAFQHLNNFRQESRFYTWLYSIAHNLAVNHLRKKIRLQEKELKENFLTFEQNQKALKKLTQFLPMEKFDVEEAKNFLQNCLAILSEKQKEVFILYVIKRIPQRQIAAMLGINYGTVRSRLYYSKKKIKNFYSSLIDFDK